MNLVLFGVLALLALLGGLGVILARSPVHNVLALVLTFVALAVLYITVAAEFLAVIQIIIYAGAIMILFLFVIALLTVRNDPVERPEQRLRGQIAMAAACGLVVLVGLVLAALTLGQGSLAPAGADFGTVKSVGRAMLIDHVFAFQLTAMALMVAVVGVVVFVARKQA